MNLRRAILEVLKRDWRKWWTVADVAGCAGISEIQASGTLWRMARAGEIARAAARRWRGPFGPPMVIVGGRRGHPLPVYKLGYALGVGTRKQDATK